jgi:hypothetical protein
MTKDQAKKLYQLADEEHLVLYNASPYVASVDSGYIDKVGEDYIYRDSAIVDVNVEEADVEDFDVYVKFADWEAEKEF